MRKAADKSRIFRVDHSEPGAFILDYILLPYGEYYKKTAALLNAKPGDTMRFFNGRDARIQAVQLIEDPELCTALCRMRYGIAWPAAFDRWLHYARLEGNGKDILVPSKCIMVVFEYEQANV